MDTEKGFQTPLKFQHDDLHPWPARYRFLWIGLVLSLALLPAKDGVRADVGSALIPLLVGADGHIQQYRDAKERIESGDILDGLRKLQALHEKIWGSDPLVEIDATDQWRVARPLSEKIIETLRALGPEQQQVYRQEFESRASSVIGRAMEMMDPLALLRVADLYPLTRHRMEALIAAGDLFLERDQSAMAVAAWDLVTSEVQTGLVPDPGDPDLLHSLLTRRWIALSRNDDQEQVEALEVEAQKLGVELPEGPIAGGSSGSQIVPENPIEQGVVAWKTHNYYSHVAVGKGRGRSYFPNLTDSILTPCFSKDWVAIATSKRLLRYDLRTGKLIANSNLHSRAPYFEEQDPDVRLWAVTDDNLLLAAYVAEASRREDYLGFDIQVSLPSRGMKCWDVGGDGRLLWDTADRGSGDDLLRTSSFNSPPVLKDGKIWALGWRKSGYIDVTLWCLDARTGEKIWSRPIVGNQVELTMFGEPAREPILGSVLVEDNFVYCCTNMGAIAALRAWDGQVQWIAEYERISQKRYRGRYNHSRGNLVWAPNPLVLHDGILFVTPLDSQQLHAISAKSGSLLSQIDGKSYGPHMLGVTDGRLVLFGDLITSMAANDIGNADLWIRGVTRSPAAARPALVEEGVVYINSSESTVVLQGIDRRPKAQVLASLSDSSNRVRPGFGGFQPEIPIGGRVDVVGDRIILTNLSQATCLTQKMQLWEEKKK